MLFEALEGRRMFSVSAAQVGGILLVNGTSGADDFIVADADDGEGTVVVVDNTVDPEADPEAYARVFQGVSLVLVNAGDGVDTLNVSTALVNMVVSAGKGDDYVQATGLGRGPGQGGTILVDGGQGNDHFVGEAVSGARIVFAGGAGKDWGMATATDGGTVWVDAGSDDDGTVQEQNWILSANGTGSVVTFNGGSGNDSATIDAVTLGGRVDVTGGAGNDTVITFAVIDETGTVTISGGLGADTVELGGAINGTVDVSGNAGNDVFNLIGLFGPTATVTVNGGAGNDTYTITGTVASGGSVTVDGGAGSDTITTGANSVEHVRVENY